MSRAVLSACIHAFHFATRCASPRASAMPMKALSAACRNHPNQTLSPRPSWPTRFMPSFQSPPPINGRPWAPTARLASRARAQCSYRLVISSDDVGWKKLSLSPGSRAWPTRKGEVSSSTAASPVRSM